LEVVHSFLENELTKLMRVDFVLFGQKALDTFIETAKKEKLV
jgi:hypothetical protein